MDELNKLTDLAEKQFADLIDTLRSLEGVTCKMANNSPTKEIMKTNAYVTEALGDVYRGKAAATKAGCNSPGNNPRFGGK